MQPFQVALRPSRLLYGIQTAAFGAAALLFAYYLPMPESLMLLLLPLAAAAVWRGNRRRILSAYIDGEGRLFPYFPDRKIQAEAEIDGTWLRPWAAAVWGHSGGRRFVWVMFPDQTDAETLRRLRVWLLWGQNGG